VKVLVSWLRDLVEVPVAIPTLAHDLHMAGFEVASVEPVQSSSEDDAVIDFEITANRPDCLSLIGLAREVATRYGTALHVPGGMDLGAPSAKSAGPLTVTIEDPTRCPRYCAALADVTVGPSPAWLADRLVASGVRSISNIVDITNYVLLELGHPMHAFDLAKLAGPELRVRAARQGETLTTLDGQKRTLTPEMLVIADRDRAQALGGIMGGADSEVSATTTTIALESAWFLPAATRRTGKRLGLSTEASYRFERGADFNAAPEALARACALIEQIGAGTVRRGWVDACPAVRPPVVMTLELARVGRVLGAEVSAADTRRILTGLGFVLSDEVNGVVGVSAPSWRVDVARDIDLIEEVARHFGYDRLPPTFPALTTVPPRPDPRLEQDRAIRRLTAAAGFTESVTFSFIAEKAAREFVGDAPLVEIMNPLSETFAVLRPSLLPGLVDAVAHNRRHGQRDVRLFELGTRFVHDRGESRTLSLAMTGAAAPEHWSGRPRLVDFFDASGVVEGLCQALGLAASLSSTDATHLARGRAARVHVAAQDGSMRDIGSVGQLAPALADARGVPAQDEIYVAELDLDAVADLITLLEISRTRPLPRFPSIVRDVSILVDDTLKTSDVRDTIRSAASATLVRIAEFDRYQGKGIPEGKVSLSYRLTFQAADRTLTDAEADEVTAAIVGALSRAHNAQRR
jgi:phenylalanyl-tRNA synthetase beta chain